MRTGEMAQCIIRRFIPEDSGQPTRPDANHLQSLAGVLGVNRVLYRSLNRANAQHPGVDAMLVPLDQGYSIVISENAPRTRQRYSFAHELAHIMLLETEPSAPVHEHLTRYRTSSSPAKAQKAEERLCDAIAAELLMPEGMFTATMVEYGPSLQHLPEMANLYNTSLTATAIRYWELLPEPCDLIKWASLPRRKGAVAPGWQMRNKVPGLRLRQVGAPSRARPNEFRVVREAWNTLKTSKSREDLLVEHKVAGRRYFQAMTFETESIGFGGLGNRTVLSAVYLGRT